MTEKKYVLALDQGTTSSRCILFDRDQNMVSIAQREFTQHYPRPGWVEHDPMEIYSSQYGVLHEVLAQSGVDAREIAAIGISNQRETTILWDRQTGKPVCNAIVWQCRRTAAQCEALQRDAAFAAYVREHTGLLIDAYFSATKIQWVLDNVPGARQKAENGQLLFGTVDTWLVWKLTGGAVHVTDYTNASRTMLYDIGNLCWDKNICERLNIPMSILPDVRPSSEIYGTVRVQGAEIPVAGIAGDQQAALFGQTCFEQGQAKNTYGTGCFLLMNTGSRRVQSQRGLITTIAVGLNGGIQYALEGSVFIGGAAVQWLRDELHFIHDAADTEYFASKVPDSGGVYVVPAFTGLGAPYWDMYARGVIVGLTRGAGRNHIIRATLESIAYQTADVLHAMEQDTGITFPELRVDGGASANHFLMQFQSDIIGRRILRPRVQETTALGAACLAGLAVGFWESRDDLRKHWTLDTCYEPEMSAQERETLVHGWQKAVTRAMSWDEDS